MGLHMNKQHVLQACTLEKETAEVRTFVFLLPKYLPRTSQRIFRLSAHPSPEQAYAHSPLHWGKLNTLDTSGLACKLIHCML